MRREKREGQEARERVKSGIFVGLILKNFSMFREQEGMVRKPRHRGIQPKDKSSPKG